MAKEKSKYRRVTEKEIEYIRANVLKKKDEIIANDLGRPIKFVRKWRKKLGITKGPKGSTKHTVTDIGKLTDIPKDTLKTITKDMSEEQRKELFKTQMVNSLYYEQIKEAFSEDEIKFYLEEYGALSVQFEDVIATEKRQIDELIKTQIISNRILKHIRITEDEIRELQFEIENFRRKNNMDLEENQERDFKLTQMVRMMSASSNAMTNDYQKLIDQKNKILEQLNARRKDRIEQIKSGNTTFVGLVQKFREEEIRDREARQMELGRLAKEKKKDEWRKPIMFADGVRDCILLDENSTVPTNEIVLINEKDSKFFREFYKSKDKKILIIDDDNRRKQFFIEVFKNNEVEFSSNPQDANKKVRDRDYDLICLDFDLGLGQDGTYFVNFILNKGLCRPSKILIHSMNVEGSEKLRVMLSGEREIEKLPFEDLLNLYKEIKEEENKENKNAS